MILMENKIVYSEYEDWIEEFEIVDIEEMLINMEKEQDVK